ncbi:MAG: response regulator [Bacteroidota bacterium]
MHTEIKIGIVEDELIIAEKIKRLLLAMGYLVCEPASNYADALVMIKKEKPDMLLIDINLKEKKDGIDLAEKINESYQLPFIFLTANSDSNTVDRAKKVKPNAYIVKPFNKEELFAAIEIAFNNYSTSKASTSTTIKTDTPKDFIFIRESHRFIKLLFNEIVYMESRENYVLIHTKEKKGTIIRSTFSDFLTQLPAEKFYRTHRSFAVQINLVENIEPTEVFACGFKIPISNTYRVGLFNVLGIKE